MQFTCLLTVINSYVHSFGFFTCNKISLQFYMEFVFFFWILINHFCLPTTVVIHDWDFLLTLQPSRGIISSIRLERTVFFILASFEKSKTCCSFLCLYSVKIFLADMSFLPRNGKYFRVWRPSLGSYTPNDVISQPINPVQAGLTIITYIFV